MVDKDNNAAAKKRVGLHINEIFKNVIALPFWLNIGIYICAFIPCYQINFQTHGLVNFSLLASDPYLEIVTLWEF